MLLVVDYSCCIVIQLQLLIMQLQLLHAAMVAATYCVQLLHTAMVAATYCVQLLHTAMVAATYCVQLLHTAMVAATYCVQLLHTAMVAATYCVQLLHTAMVAATYCVQLLHTAMVAATYCVQLLHTAMVAATYCVQLLHTAMVAASDDYCELLLLYTCHYMPVISRHNVFLRPDAATMFQSIRDRIKFCCSHRPREWACAPVHRVGILSQGVGVCTSTPGRNIVPGSGRVHQYTG